MATLLETLGELIGNACPRPAASTSDARLMPLDPGPQPGTWTAEGGRPKKYCGNREMPARCNWMVAVEDPSPFCISCRLNRTIPNLDDQDNARYWGLIETAKRRLVSELLALGLPVKSKVDEDEEHGLMFDFLRSPPQGPRPGRYPSCAWQRRHRLFWKKIWLPQRHKKVRE